MKCSNCHSKINLFVKQCPHCGENIDPTRRNSFVFFFITVFVIFLCFTSYKVSTLFGNDNSISSSSDLNSFPFTVSYDDSDLSFDSIKFYSDSDFDQYNLYAIINVNTKGVSIKKLDSIFADYPVSVSFSKRTDLHDMSYICAVDNGDYRSLCYYAKFKSKNPAKQDFSVSLSNPEKKYVISGVTPGSFSLTSNIKASILKKMLSSDNAPSSLTAKMSTETEQTEISETETSNMETAQTESAQTESAPSAAEPPQSGAAEPSTPAQEEAPTLSTGQSNALSKAAEYLQYSAFSYSGLIGQLEYEGFSTEDATYAVDNCGADWNEQAAMKAQQYLDYSSFSRDSLIDQLEYEGFTQSQAEYGVSAVGY